MKSFPHVNYDTCSANLACSILNYYGIKAPHKTLPLADKLLQSDEYDNVILLLLDGLGISVMKNNLSAEGFLFSHLKGNYNSVFLPTTVAATTSIMSGLYPSETGWLAWDMWFPEIQKNVTTFLNTVTGTETPAADYYVAMKHRPYQNVVKIVGEKGRDFVNGQKIETHLVAPFAEPKTKKLSEQMDYVFNILKGSDNKKYIYWYNPDPDGTMHNTGVNSAKTKAVIKEYEKQIEAFTKKLQLIPENTLLLITADHSQIDTKHLVVLDYPEIMNCLKQGPSLEPRALNFFVKPECMDTFPQIFNRYFEKDFMLCTKQEVLDGGLFGPTENEHPAFRETLGDYIALATGDISLHLDHGESSKLIGFHGGLTKEEMEVPLIAIKA